MHSRLHLALGVLASTAVAVVSSVARADASCTYGPGVFIKTKLAVENGVPANPPYDVALLQLPGGTAEYSARDVCTVLTFTAIRNGEAMYTDDGLGRGLTVVVTKDDKLIVSHVAGWIAKSE